MKSTDEPRKGSSRRQFLISAAGGVAGVAISAALPVALTPRHAVLAQSTLTPEAALDELMAGNKRYLSGKLSACGQDLAKLRQKYADKQEPFAAVLGCADSRLPAELIFDQTIGGIFVTRVAGNVVAPEIIGSLEYGAAVLGTKAILLQGHSKCGAVKAAMQMAEVPGQISSLYPHIRPAVEQAGNDLEAAIKANVKVQANLLSTSSTVISGLVKEQKIKVAAGYYDIVSGSVTLL